MFYVYLIQSLSDGSIYIGYTDNIEKRLAQHNDGRVNYINISHIGLYTLNPIGQEKMQEGENNCSNIMVGKGIF